MFGSVMTVVILNGKRTRITLYYEKSPHKWIIMLEPLAFSRDEEF